jgi:hypothetical protein
MIVHIRTLTGRIISLAAEPTDTIELIKTHIQEKECIPMYRQRLIFAKSELENERTLADCEIQNDSKLFLLIRLRDRTS